MNKGIGYFFLLAILAMSCLDEIKLPQPTRIERIVVEGGISDVASANFLRLSYTDGVGGPKRVLPTSGVYVEIQNTKGEKTVMRADPLGTGLFTPERGSFLGKPGEDYNLYIKISDGREYKSASQEMPNAVKIKQLNYLATEKPRVGYAISADIEDPKNSENYYRWKAESFSIRKSTGVPVSFSICCTTCWVKDISEEINMLSDINFNGNTIKNHPVFFSQYYGASMHKVKIRQYGITKDAFQYYTKLRAQLSRTGSIFDPLPATVRGNIVNVKDSDDTALGFFEVSTVSTKELDILEKSLSKYDLFYDSELYIRKGDCMLAYPYSLYFETYEQNLFN
jgi:Domain of unknown function (DUF4249)